MRLSRIVLHLAVAPLCILLLGAGCIPGNSASNSTGTYLASLDQTNLSLLNAGVPLRANPGFSPDDLSDEARELYDELWASIDSPEQRAYIERLAASDNLYEYGRLVYTHISGLLAVFRLTGDPALLDRVDDLTEIMRAQLDDSWRDVSEGNASEGRDGYLNWVWRNSTSDTHHGKDLHETDEMRAHAMIAEVAWAFRANAELESPKGVDYGLRSEFWQSYLRDHFEAKWRERNEVRWPRFPFLQRPYIHPTLAFAKYHYYMYRLSDRSEYLNEAKRLSDIIFEEFHEVETDSGPAFVWMRSIASLGGSERYLMPTDYSSLVIADALSLHLDGFYAWADPRVPHRLANTVAEFIIDQGEHSFARDVGGGERRAGISPSSARDWQRVTPSEFSINTFAFLSAWDESGEIARVSHALLEELPSQHNYPYIPVGLLVAELHRPALAAAEGAGSGQSGSEEGQPDGQEGGDDEGRTGGDWPETPEDLAGPQ